MRRKMITVSTALALMLSVAGCKDKAPDTGDPTTRGAENTSATLYTPEDTETHSNIIEESVTENATDPTSSTQSNAHYLLLGFTGQPMFIRPKDGLPLILKADTSEIAGVSYQWQCRQDYEAWHKVDDSLAETAALFINVSPSLYGSQYRCMITTADGDTKYTDTIYLMNEIPLTTTFFGEALLPDLKRNDLDGDGQLSRSEVNLVTSISISHYDFVDNGTNALKGIELFRYLETLSYSNCRMESLDLSFLPNLEYLYCTDNQLSSLDVSHNTWLTELHCTGNQLSSLDVSHNPMLTELHCSNNQLTNLDLSRNPLLTELYCENNRLTNLDLSQNPALKNLSCCQNQLTSLDLSQNQSLEMVNVIENPLTELNCAGANSLRVLECWNDPLPSIDLSGCTSLVWIGIDSTTSITGLCESAEVFRRYEPSGLIDGYYSYDGWTGSVQIIDAEKKHLHFEDVLYPDDSEYPFREYGHFGDLLIKNDLDLPLANNVTYLYKDNSEKVKSYKAADFDTFYQDMWAKALRYTSADYSGNVTLRIHLSGGVIDEILADIFITP
jgi:hypothetical protein